MVALGNPYIKKATPNNCYFHQIPEDSIEGIFEAAFALAKTFSYGGGQGIDIGQLRPKGAKVSNTARFSTGAISFLELYATITRIIGQNGRRGALMISCPITHPDIEDFIEVKRVTKQVEEANLSVKMLDEFMNAVEEDKPFDLFFQTTHEEFRKTVKARELFRKLCISARDSGDPGLLFWDRIKKMSPSEIYPELQVGGTNPCGEIPLENDGVCCLGSMLLHKFVIAPYTREAQFDYIHFATMVQRAVRHLDTVVSISSGKHALEAQNNKAILGRRIGLGFTGLADMLAAMGQRYDEADPVLIQRIMGVKRRAEYGASIDLAQEKGSFLLYRPEHFDQECLQDLGLDILVRGRQHGLRNVAISTVAPSGTLSIMAQCSSGIEPHYDLNYKRAVLLGAKRVEYDIQEYGVVRYRAATNKDPEELFVPAYKVNWEQRIKLQGMVQQFVDSAISSTVNLPKGTTVEQIENIYTEAWKQGLKGITVYVDGSKKGILRGKNEVDGDSVCYRFRAEGGDKFYVHISYQDKQKDKPYQVFITNYKATEYDRFVKITNELRKLLLEKGIATLKEGEGVEDKLEQQTGRSKNTLEKMTRFMSLAFKSGYLDDVIEILDRHSFVGTMAARLKEILLYKDMALACPKCGEKMLAKQGCFSCSTCGYEKCGG
jgi:ribonucleoside-diphosphate reductase alpha chain